MRRPGLDQAEVEGALKEAAWLSIHGSREDKDGIFRGPQLVLPDMEKVKRRMKAAAEQRETELPGHGQFAEAPQKPYRSDE